MWTGVVGYKLQATAIPSGGELEKRGCPLGDYRVLSVCQCGDISHGTVPSDGLSILLICNISGLFGELRKFCLL